MIKKILLSAVVAASFLLGMSTIAAAKSKMSRPHSDVALEMFKAPTLMVPGMVLDQARSEGIKVAGRRGRRNTALAIGAAALLLGGAAHAGRHRGRRGRGYRARRYRRGPSCRTLLRRCDNGLRRACRRYNRRCD